LFGIDWSICEYKSGRQSKERAAGNDKAMKQPKLSEVAQLSLAQKNVDKIYNIDILNV